MKEQKYFAFISYKREDEKWAKWLQRRIEHYRFPTNLNGRTDLPKNIRPTFRDITDLNPGLLTYEIEQALLDSEWLIIICSPRSAKSPWVCKEAQNFVERGKADHIIPFVIEGVPFSKDERTECYPNSLLRLTDDRELLAANINEMGREAAAIKVIARMFNLRFDTLWQRHEREQRHKKWLWIASALLIALIGIGIGSYFIRQNQIIERQNLLLEKATKRLKEDSVSMASHLLRIMKDSIILATQNDSIFLQNNIISSQRDSIEYSNTELQTLNQLLEEERNLVTKANRDLKQSNALIMAENALSQLSSGNIIKARNTLKSICDDDAAQQLCSLTNVEYALRKVYREFMHEGIRMRYSIENIGNISVIKLDDKGDNLYVVTNDSLVIEYDAKLGMKKNVINAILNCSDLDVRVHDFDATRGILYYTTDSVVYIRDIYKIGNCRTIYFETEIRDVIISPQYNYIICWLKNNETLDFEYHLVNLCKKEDANKIIPNCKRVYSFSPDGRCILADLDGKCCIYNLEYGRIEKVIPHDFRIRNAKIIGARGEHILFEQYDEDFTNYPSEGVSANIYDIPSGEFLEFANIIGGDGLTMCELQITPQGNRIITTDLYGNFTIYDVGLLPYYEWFRDDIRISGRPITSLSGHSEYIKSITFNKSGTMMSTFSNGKICVWDVNVKDIFEEQKESADFIASSGLCYIKSTKIYDVSSSTPRGIALFESNLNSRSRERIKLISRNQNLLVTTKDSLVFVYDLKNPEKDSIPFYCHEYSLELSIDKNGEKLVIWDDYNGNEHGHKLMIYDSKNNIVTTLNDSIRCSAMEISPNGEYIAISDGYNIAIHMANTLKQKIKFPKVHSGYICSICYSPDGNYIASASWDKTVCLWDAAKGTLIKTFYGAERELRDCSISYNGKHIIASTRNDQKGNIMNYIWGIDSGEIVEKLESEYSYRFCQDIPNKLYSALGYHYHLLDFPSREELMSFFTEGEQ